MDESDLERGLFGYSRKSVRQLVADREAAFGKAIEEVRTASARVAQLEEELGTRGPIERGTRELEARNRKLGSELDAASRRIRELEEQQAAVAEAPTIPSTAQGLGDVLEATEQALAQLFDDAGMIAEKRLRDSERARDELRTEIEQLAEWRRRVLPLADAVRRSIDEARTQVAAADERLRSAVAPATNAMQALEGRLAELADASAPPARVTRAAGGEHVIRIDEGPDEAGGEGPGSSGREAVTGAPAQERGSRPTAE